jgi:hypothetical protein
MTITPQQHATALAAAQAELKLQSELEDTFGIGLWFEDPAGPDGMRIDGLLNLPALVDAILKSTATAAAAALPAIAASSDLEWAVSGDHDYSVMGAPDEDSAYRAAAMLGPSGSVYSRPRTGAPIAHLEKPRDGGWTRQVARPGMTPEALGEETKAKLQQQMENRGRRAASFRARQADSFRS